MKKERKRKTRKTGIKVTIITEENQQNIKVKMNGTLNDVSKLQNYMIQLILKELTDDLIKTSGNYNSKGVEFKSRWSINCKIGERNVIRIKEIKERLCFKCL